MIAGNAAIFNVLGVKLEEQKNGEIKPSKQNHDQDYTENNNGRICGFLSF